MGGSSSKQYTPTGPSAGEVALQKAAFVPEEIARQLQQQSDAARLVAEQAAATATAQASRTWFWAKALGGFFGVAILAIVIIYVYDYFALQRCGQTILLPPQPCKESFTTQATPPATKLDTAQVKPAPKTGPPSLFSKLTTTVTGSDSSGDLISSIHDASTSITIPASSAPLSNQTQGSYSMQWWMFVNDWNYGYGKEKPVLQRSDPTNTAIMNPAVSLHPTDNTLKITVSVFPDGESSSKIAPAPATGSSSSTDDVYTCEVTNIPLQAWFSVSISVFGRNLDVYIDGKLVKSCFLSGVPKPATGDISITPDGGYSGYMCNLHTYPRMLNPSDATTFFSAGSTCQSATGTSSAASLTGYSVKFGVYNPQGKEIQEYSF
jgi:hypothetical protein